MNQQAGPLPLEVSVAVIGAAASRSWLRPPGTPFYCTTLRPAPQRLAASGSEPILSDSSRAVS